MTKRVWQKDEDVTNCTQCNVAFSFWVRRHHCRNCGQIFCNNCSSKLCIVSHFNKYLPERVCDACYINITTSRNGKQTNKSRAITSNSKACNEDNIKIRSEKLNDTSATTHHTILSENNNNLNKTECNNRNSNASADGTPTNFSTSKDIDTAATNHQSSENIDDVSSENKNNMPEITRHGKDISNNEVNADIASTSFNGEDEQDVFKSYYEECYQEHEKMLHLDHSNKELEAKVSGKISADEYKGHNDITTVADGRQIDVNSNSASDKLHYANSKTVLLKERLRKLREEKPFYEVGALYVDEVHYNSTTTVAEDDLERYERYNSIEEIIHRCFPLPQPVDNSVACLWQPVSSTDINTSLAANSNTDCHNSSSIKDLIDDVANSIDYVTEQLMKVTC